MNTQINNWQYALENAEALQATLAKRNILAESNQVCKGSGVAGLFGTTEDIAQVRLGREHSKGYKDFRFNAGWNMPSVIVLGDYCVFLPLSASNIRAVLNGDQFDYSVVNRVKEDHKGLVEAVDPTEIRKLSGGNIDTLVGLMPRKRIPGVQRTNVKIGNAVFPEVKASNVDDGGDVSIDSLRGFSSVLYNPTEQTTPRPEFVWGGSWTEPIEIKVVADRLFFDERKKHEGKLWLLDFQREGYNPTAF